MTDKITGEEAKEVIQRIRNCVGEFKPTSFIHFPVYRNTIPALDMAIKSLEQDKPMGHWEYIQEARGTCGFVDKYHICSVCGTRALAEGSSDLADECLSDYCPKCGTKMVD